MSPALAARSHTAPSALQEHPGHYGGKGQEKCQQQGCHTGGCLDSSWGSSAAQAKLSLAGRRLSSQGHSSCGTRGKMELEGEDVGQDPSNLELHPPTG